MPRRLFIAIPVSSDLRYRVTQWQEQHQDLPVKWMTAKDLHITLIPPWQDDKPEELIERLGKFVSPAFMKPAQFEHVRSGPTRFNPRLVWALGEATPDILKLKKEVEHALAFEPDARPFRLHLTLARFAPGREVPFNLRRFHDRISWTQSLDRIALYESHLDPEGSVTYDILAEFPCSHLPTI
jgi:2'-5' RNA ligase